MKNIKTYSADSETRGNASAAGIGGQTAVVAQQSKKEQHDLPRIEEGHKLVRRYSFDDNGGGYLGL